MARVDSVLTHHLSSDVFPALFDWFFTHPSFERWSRERIKWQLHCIGSPGSGKTTLAALTARYLEEKFQPHGLVITLFVQEDASVQEPEFLEDFLVAIYQRIGEWEECTDDGSENDYTQYEIARYRKPGGRRVQFRLSIIRKALYGRLQALKDDSRIFLVIDGIDCGSASLRLLLDAEFCDLQRHRVSIMLTSRIATYEYWEVKCDHRDHGEALDSDSDPDRTSDGATSDRENSNQGEISSERGQRSEGDVLAAVDKEEDQEEDKEADEDEDGDDDDDDEEPIDYGARERLELYLTCDTCKDVLCFACRSVGRICANCESSDKFSEDYDHVNIVVGTTEEAMKAFIIWDMEREHGDLGLGSSAVKPPLSILGSSLRNYPGRARAIADQIEDQADGHIGLAKAGLDSVHDARSADDLLQLRYQLPNNIVTLYEAAIKVLEAQDTHQRDLGLKVLAAARRDPDGVDIPRMQELLHDSVAIEIRSGEDITRAARGFLSVMAYERPHKVVAFHETFWDFVADRYSESLHEASQALGRNRSMRKTFSYHGAPATGRTQVRWEPMTLSEEPAEITPARLKRTVTSMQTIVEAPPVRTYVLRKGTRMWR